MSFVVFFSFLLVLCRKPLLPALTAVTAKRFTPLVSGLGD